jgi:hypothetical protein
MPLGLNLVGQYSEANNHFIGMIDSSKHLFSDKLIGSPE